MSAIERISVIVPMRNEAENVESFIRDLAAQDFVGETEILVADGGSTDGSARLLRETASKAGLNLQVLENPAGFVSPGLNACIRQASGELLIRLDCHTRYPRDYLRRCAELSEQTGAANVGGIAAPEGQTPMERAVACAMLTAFGGMGWTRHGGGDTLVAVDTVAFGAFRPETFQRVGLYDESLVRNQDDELNLRLLRAGGRVILDPRLVSRYRPRGSLSALWRQHYQYGFWKVPVMAKHRRILTARSAAPLVLITSLGALLAISPRYRPARVLLVAEAGAYGAVALVFSAYAVKTRREPCRLLPRVLAAYPTMHVSYGTGMVAGILGVISGRWSTSRRPGEHRR